MKNIELTSLITKTVVAMGYEFVGLEQVMGKPMILKIYVDKDGGVDLDALAALSRQIGSTLDVESFTEARYMLEVSSPGIERPLFTVEQFSVQLGKKISIKLQTVVDNRRKLIGTLLKVEGNIISVEIEPSIIIEVDFDNITKAKLVCDDLIIGKGKQHE